MELMPPTLSSRLRKFFRRWTRSPAIHTFPLKPFNKNVVQKAPPNTSTKVRRVFKYTESSRGSPTNRDVTMESLSDPLELPRAQGVNSYRYSDIFPHRPVTTYRRSVDAESFATVKLSIKKRASEAPMEPRKSVTITEGSINTYMGQDEYATLAQSYDSRDQVDAFTLKSSSKQKYNTTSSVEYPQVITKTLPEEVEDSLGSYVPNFQVKEVEEEPQPSTETEYSIYASPQEEQEPEQEDKEKPQICYHFYIYFYPSDTDDGLMAFNKHIFLHGSLRYGYFSSSTKLMSEFKNAMDDRRLRSVEIQCGVSIKICHVTSWLSHKFYLPNRRVIILGDNYKKIATALSMMEELMPECFLYARFPKRLPIHTKRWCNAENFLVRPSHGAKNFQQRNRYDSLLDRGWRTNILSERIIPPITKKKGVHLDDAVHESESFTSSSSEKGLQMGQLKSSLYPAAASNHNRTVCGVVEEDELFQLHKNQQNFFTEITSCGDGEVAPMKHSEDDKFSFYVKVIEFPASKCARRLLVLDTHGKPRNPQLFALERTYSCNILKVYKLIVSDERKQSAFYRLRVRYVDADNFGKFCTYFRRSHFEAPRYGRNRKVVDNTSMESMRQRVE